MDYNQQHQQQPYGHYGDGGGGASSRLRRRTVADSDYSRNGHDSNGAYGNGNADADDKYGSKSVRRRMVRRLDMFPKVETDLEVKTERGGLVTLVGYGIVFFLVLNELLAHRAMNQDTIETVVVDTSLSPKMNVNINISFPAIACVDLHLDVMDVAGDSQMNIEDTLMKRKISKTGKIMQTKSSTMEAKVNQAHEEDVKKKKILEETNKPGEDYCGPCYGAAETDDQCCNDCDSVVAAYKKKRWNEDSVIRDAEQCIREGRETKSNRAAPPRHITTGEGCNLSGHMSINRVNGNFHVALGEGVERNGRHIHLFVPDDAPKFNTTHTIHELTFGTPTETGKKFRNVETQGLNGVSKVVTDENGETGLFQYYLKVVPTVYKSHGGTLRERTNRYFFTDRYRPLWADAIDEESNSGDVHYEHRGGREHVGHNVGGDMKNSHSKADHHHHMNSILPGVFFIYEIYPFAVEVDQKRVPFSHFMIRIVALIGGVFTIVGWFENAMCVRDKNRRR